MTTAEFIIPFSIVSTIRCASYPNIPKRPYTPARRLHWGVLYALKGGSKRAFYRWLRRDWLAFFPRLPERTRLFRLWAAHAD